MADEKCFHVGIKALVTNEDGKILLLKENIKGGPNFEQGLFWDFPGGRMNHDESVEDTLKREVEEETGITEIGHTEFVGATVSPVQIQTKDNGVVGLVLMVYKTSIPKDAVIRLENEQVGYEWVDMSDVKERIKNKYPEEFISQL